LTAKETLLKKNLKRKNFFLVNCQFKIWFDRPKQPKTETKTRRQRTEEEAID
jgi:hypothetical protein